MPGEGARAYASHELTLRDCLWAWANQHDPKHWVTGDRKSQRPVESGQYL